MSETTAPTYLVALSSGDSSTEGTLSWALSQANAYTGEGTPTIAFAENLGGAHVDMDGFFEPTRDVRLVNLGSQQVWGAATIIREGVRVTMGQGVALSQVHIYGTLECEEGAVLDGGVYMDYDAVSPTLVMNGTRVELFISISSPGARIEGSGNTFADLCPIVFNNFSDLSAVLAGLTDSRFEAGEYYIGLYGDSSGGVLPLLPGAFKGYQVQLNGMSSTFHVVEEGTLTLAEGVSLYTETLVYGSASQPDLYFEEICLGGSFVFEGNNNIYVLNSTTQEPFSKGIVRFTAPWDSPGSSTTLTNLGNVTVHGCVELAEGIVLLGNGGSYGVLEQLGTTLTNWDGATVPDLVSSLQSGNYVSGARIVYTLVGFGGNSVIWNEDRVQALLTPDGFSHAEFRLICLNEGDSLTLPANTQWKNCSVLVREGAVLECGRGCRLADDPSSWVDEVDDNPAVVVESGGTLVADKLTIDGTLALAPGAKVTGSLHFAKGSRIRLAACSGDTQQLLDSILADATWTADAPPLIELDWTVLEEGDFRESITMISGDTILSDLGSRFGGYVIGELGGHISSEYSLTVRPGVDIVVEDMLEGCGMVFEGDNVVSLAAGYDGYVGPYGGGVVAHGTRFEIPVMGVDADTLSGDNITFAAQIPFGIRLGDYGYSPSAPWDGTAAALQAAIDKALQNVAGYTIEPKNPILGLAVGSLAADLLLSPETMAGMLPAGFAGLHFEHLNIEEGRTVRVACGATLDCGSVEAYGGSLIIEAGAALIDSLEPIEHEPDIGVMEGGTLSMKGVDFAGAYIYVADGTATISDCWGKGSLRLSPYDNAQSVVRVTGCDLSEMDIKLYSNMGDGSAVYDFSGNYWGTSDVEKIKSMISGYDASSVIIGEVLASSPFGPDTTPPEISLLAPQTAKKGEGQTAVTLAWSASADAVRYELRVDGKLAYSGSDTTHTLTLKDGSHSYSVKAWDEAGNAATAQGDAFTLDATAPALSLNSPRMEKPGNGNTRVTLSWSADEVATYELRVNGELQAISGNSHTLELADGTYSYSVSATDARGNSVTQEGRFTCDASAPALTMDTPVITSASKGKTKLSFNWSGEAGSIYTLTLNGKKVYSGTKASYSTTLADGTHRYTLVAKDATGNDATLTGSVVTDATAPVITLKNPAFDKAGEGRVNVTLNWWTNEAATCTVQVDKMAVYTVQGNSFTLPAAIADGKHSYVITATDALGNSSTKKGSFNYDATAPKLTLSTPKLKKAGEGRVAVTLKWKGESKASYRVCVDGNAGYTYEGTGSSCTFTLPDGAHSYTVTATDKAGNSITREGSFSYDATAPELSLLAPALTKAGAGKLFATLNWAGTGADTYILKVDGKKKYEGSATSFSLDLKDGKHSYSVTAQDAAGNKVTQNGNFVYDATAPKLKLKKPVLSKAGQGAINALFSWTTEKDAVCRLIVDGEERYSGKGSSCQLRLEGDKHSYFVEVVDAAGNTTRSEEAGLSLDTTDPGLILESAVAVVSGSALKTSLSWAGEAGVSYTVKVDNKKVYSGKKLTCSVNLTPGEHDCTITAKDAAGNTSTLTTTLSVSALGGAPKIEVPSASQTLAWQAEDSAGISGSVGRGNSVDSYCFTLKQATTLTLRLGGLEAPASLLLFKDYGLGVVEQQARHEVSGGSGLDRELSLSAGSYCLQVKGYDASLAQYDTGYTLDLELGSGDSRKQAVLAALS